MPNSAQECSESIALGADPDVASVQFEDEIHVAETKSEQPAFTRDDDPGLYDDMAFLAQDVAQTQPVEEEMEDDGEEVLNNGDKPFGIEQKQFLL